MPIGIVGSGSGKPLKKRDGNSINYRAPAHRMRPDNLLIVGASNNGKTAIARRFLARHIIAENPDAERSHIETTLVQAPNGPSIPQLLRSILTALGREPGPRPTSPGLGPKFMVPCGTSGFDCC